MRRVAIVLALFIVALYATTAFAVAPYYEFAPDYSQSMLVASSDTVEEVFLPLNEFLSGFDFWVSNDGEAGNATFTLFGPSGSQLAERTISVPSIPDSGSGTRLHVNIGQFAVTGTSPYKVRVSTAVPTFRLYYADQNKLVAHNGAPSQAYSGGLARIGGEDKGFSFTFALYENAETAPPIISNAGTSQSSIDEVVLSFNANEPVDYQVHYGSETTQWTGSYSSCLPGIQTCTVRLPVIPATTYSYTLSARDVWGNTSSFSGAFTSLDYGQATSPTPTAGPGQTATPTPTATPDTTAPVIANPRVAVLTPHMASFAWTTNEAANGTVVVQLTPVLITVGGNSDATLELEHFVSVGNLTADTYYQATITTADSSNNTSTAVVTFLTPKDTPSPKPTPHASPGASSTPTASPAPSGTPTPSALSSTGPSGAAGISWQAPASGEPAGGYRIDVFDQHNKLIRTISVASGTHQAQLGQLPSGDNTIIVYASHDGVFEKVAVPSVVKVRNISTTERVLQLSPYILAGLVGAVALAIGGMKLRARRKSPAPPIVAPVSGGQASVPK